MVTPEGSRTDRFIRFMNRLRGQQRLDRIVIDECHVVLNDQATFRPRLRELGDLNRMQVQMVILTAILPPEEETRFIERIWMVAGDVTTFRESTVRTNIAYRVRPLRQRTSRAQEEELIAMIEEQRRRL